MPERPERTHVFIIDGTLSTLEDGQETNAGLLYKLLTENGPTARTTVGYDPGVQAQGLMKWVHIAAGSGINLSILDGYAALASRYEPGDNLMLFGFSRGAYAARSLAGFIGRIGLLRRELATERRIQRAFRLYEAAEVGDAARAFTAKYCHDQAPINVLGVWDTVKALGLPYPLLNRLAPMATEFHDHLLSPSTENAFHAIAIDENRTSYECLPWKTDPGSTANVEQAWFPGAHGDIGGHINTSYKSRTLSNIPLVWMLERAQSCGLELPDGWQEEFPCDPAAPMQGPYRRSARLFIDRKPRVVGNCSSEYMHESVRQRQQNLPRYKPRAIINIRQTKSQSEPSEPIPEAQPEPAMS